MHFSWDQLEFTNVTNLSGNKEIKFKQYSLKRGTDENERSFLFIRVEGLVNNPMTHISVTCVFDISLFQTDPKRLQAFFYNLHAKTQNMLWKSSINVKWILEYFWSLVWFSLNYIWIYISKIRPFPRHFSHSHFKPSHTHDRCIKIRWQSWRIYIS